MNNLLPADLSGRDFFISFPDHTSFPAFSFFYFSRTPPLIFRFFSPHSSPPTLRSSPFLYSPACFLYLFPLFPPRLPLLSYSTSLFHLALYPSLHPSPLPSFLSFNPLPLLTLFLSSHPSPSFPTILPCSHFLLPFSFNPIFFSLHLSSLFLLLFFPILCP